MTLTFDKLTFQLCNSEEQLGNLSVIAPSTLLSTPVRSVWVVLLSKLTLNLINDLEDKMDVCMRINPFKSLLFYLAKYMTL